MLLSNQRSNADAAGREQFDRFDPRVLGRQAFQGLFDLGAGQIHLFLPLGSLGAQIIAHRLLNQHRTQHFVQQRHFATDQFRGNLSRRLQMLLGLVPRRPLAVKMECHRSTGHHRQYGEQFEEEDSA